MDLEACLNALKNGYLKVRDPISAGEVFALKPRYDEPRPNIQYDRFKFVQGRISSSAVHKDRTWHINEL